MKTTVLNVAPGTYDMFVIFIPYNPDLSGSMQWDFYSPKHLVIKEQVEVSEDLELTFDETTASNYIEFSAVTPDGEDFKYPVFDGQSQDYTKANIAVRDHGYNHFMQHLRRIDHRLWHRLPLHPRRQVDQ